MLEFVVLSGGTSGGVCSLLLTATLLLLPGGLLSLNVLMMGTLFTLLLEHASDSESMLLNGPIRGRVSSGRRA